MSVRAVPKSKRSAPARKPAARAARDTYRHGNLKHALLEESIRVMDQRSDTSFTLREVAQRLGVSHSAAYRHFPSKAALLAEIACRGFQLLTNALTQASAVGGKAEDILRRQAHAYVCVALQYPSYFRCMSGPHTFGKTDADRMDRLCDEAFQCLVVVARGLPGIAASAEWEANVTLSLWSAVHGLAHLAMDEQLCDFEKGSGANRLSGAIENVITIVLNGIRFGERKANTNRLP